MSFRLRLPSSVCIFAVLVSVQVLAQSNGGFFANRSNALNVAEESNPGMPRALSFASLRAAALKSPLSNSSGFATAVPYYSGGNGANAAAVADVNGDGKFDVVVSNWCSDANCTSGDVGVLLGNGDGTFQAAAHYSSGGKFANFVAIADVNGDGHPDIVVANCGSNSQANCLSTSNSGNVAVLLNNGDGTFAAAVTYPVGSPAGADGASAVAIEDVNGDGKLDLIVATGAKAGGFVGVLLGNGDGTFQAELTPESTDGNSPLALAVADVNGDGAPDVVVANQCTDNTCANSSVVVLLNNNDGSGTFQTAVPYGAGGLFPDSIAIADVNGDGKLDLVVANSSTSSTVDDGNVAILLGKGDGTFQTAVAYPSGAFGAASVAVADVNGDRRPDVVVANCSSSASNCVGSGGTVGVLLGNGDGTFQAAVTFGSGGNTPFGVAVADVNGDNKPDILAANCNSSACGAANGHVGVLLNTGLWATRNPALGQQVDYFGNGKADFSVWRPSNGTWYSTDGAGHSLTRPWGMSTDIPLVGDYDGDGKTDLAVWRPSTGTWYIIQSKTGQGVTKAWGKSGDIPVPGDYDGDGKTDIAVWRPSTGTWYIIQSKTGQGVTKAWGEAGDIPVPGDYDGDGKTDIAVWRPSNGTWYVILSSTNTVVVKPWGLSTDKPVAGDYDGDGKTDIAVWRPSNGTWYVILSSTNKGVTQPWGAAGDVPVPRDYDGDLKTDFAVWRPSNGTWYVLESTNKFVYKPWGLSTDVPINKPVGQ